MKIVCLFFVFLTHSVIGTEIRSSFGDDILLIINYNHPYYSSIPVLQELYSPWFPNIVFYGPRQHPGVHTCQHHEGWFAYTGITDAMQRYPGFNGYLQVHDDCIINCWNFTRFNKDKIWFVGAPMKASLVPNLGNWLWWKKDVGYPAAQNLFNMLPVQYKKKLDENFGPNSISWGYSDIVYFPASYTEDVVYLSTLCRKVNLFLEIALPTICACLTKKESIESINGVALWENKHLITAKYTKNIDYVHPLKLSQKENIVFIKKQYGLAG
jgi:hypothetical protein